MTQAKVLSRAVLLLGGIGLAVAAFTTPGPTHAQTYVCPNGYYYLEGYGCAPLSYYYGEPTDIFPYGGFGFFYGGRGWGGRGYNYGHGGGGFHGGGAHGGGGFHGGGGGRGGGGGGGHR